MRRSTELKILVLHKKSDPSYKSNTACKQKQIMPADGQICLIKLLLHLFKKGITQEYFKIFSSDKNVPLY